MHNENFEIFMISQYLWFKQVVGKGREGCMCVSGSSRVGGDERGITTRAHDKTDPYRLTAGKLCVSKVCISIFAYFSVGCNEKPSSISACKHTDSMLTVFD